MRTQTMMLVLAVCGAPAPVAAQIRVTSPDNRNVVQVGIREGALYYIVNRDGKSLLTPSRLGFAFADNARAWSIPSNRPRLDRSEQLYSSQPISTLDSVQTPITMETRDGKTVMVLHEANLVDYARMNIKGPRMESRTMRVDLAP